MPRLPRPSIPIEVKMRVVLRQLGELFIDDVISLAKEGRCLGDILKAKLSVLADLLGCNPDELRLDHNPALGLRDKIIRDNEIIGYRPSANDPEFLIYRTAHDHHIKTNVRGDGAQFSDTVLMKRARKGRRAPRIKRKWPSRPFPKRMILGP